MGIGAFFAMLSGHKASYKIVSHFQINLMGSGGRNFPASIILIDPLHLRLDKSRLGDIFALGRGCHRKDTAMDVKRYISLTKRRAEGHHFLCGV